MANTSYIISPNGFIRVSNGLTNILWTQERNAFDENSTCIEVKCEEDSPGTAVDMKPRFKRKFEDIEEITIMSDTEYRTETTKKLLDLLECPVCREVARVAPIYNCRNGHIICHKCHPKLDTCPVCRCPDIGGRNHFAEKLAVPLLDEEIFKCPNNSSGCEYSDLGKRLPLHMPNCVYELVACPAIHRRACRWEGPLLHAISHAGKNKCAQMLRDVNNSPFSSSIGDFSEVEFTIFQRSTNTYWKPVFLLSQSVVRFFLYLVTYRDGAGNWVIGVRSMAHPEIYQKLRVSIKLTTAPTGTLPILDHHRAASDPVFEYYGKVSSHSLCEGEVLNSGNFLLLRDEQVKLLKRDKTLFSYFVSVFTVCESLDGTEELIPIHPGQ